MAADVCFLQKDDSVEGGYSLDSVDEMLNIIERYINDGIKYSDGGQNTTILRNYIRKGLHEIGDRYSNTQLGPITRYLKEYFEQTDEGAYEVYLPQQGIYNTVSKVRRAALGDGVDLDYFLGTAKEKTSSFLEEAFGNLSDVKNKLKQDVTHRLIDAFCIDRKNGRLVRNIGEVNRNARAIKEELYQIVRNYINDSNLEESLFEDDIYTGALENSVFKSKILKLAAYLNPKDIYNIYHDMYKGGTSEADIKSREQNKALYEAITSYFILKNFDNFTNYIMGELIVPNATTFGQLVDGDVYAYSKKASHLITSWGQDGRSLEEDISKFIQALINTTPFYRYGSTEDTGRFITFEDFYRSITQIKNLVYNPKVSQQIFNSYDGRVQKFLDKLDINDQKLLEGKSLRWLINKFQDNPQKYVRLTFQALCDPDLGWMKTLDIRQQDRDYYYSIFKGFFDPNYEHSIKYIQNQYGYNDKQYYQSITHAVNSMFDVRFLQYYQNEDGSLTARALNEQNIDNARRSLELSINRGNSRNKNFFFNRTEMDPFNAKITYISQGDQKVIQGLAYELTLDSGKVLSVELNDLGQNILFKIDGKIVNEEDYNTLLYNNNVLEFINKQIKINFNKDTAYRNAVEETMGDETFKNLMHLSSVVLFNKYISSVELKNIKGPKNTRAILDSIYGKQHPYRPAFDRSYNQIKLVPDVLVLSILEDIAKAKTIVTGQVNATMVRDAEGNALPTQTTSRLYGSLHNQWEEIKETQSPASHFSLINPGMMGQVFNAKELKTLNGSKEYSKFTVAESIQASFMYDFVAGLIAHSDVSEKRVIGNGKVAFLTSVNSDKGFFGKMPINLKQVIEDYGDGNRTWESLTKEELREITAVELGEYYRKLNGAVSRDYDILNDFVAGKKEFKGIFIDYRNNFKEFNKYCKEHGIAAVDQLFKITQEYNKIHRNDPTVLIDQTHFVREGKEIKRNTTITNLIRRFTSYAENEFDDFMEIKELDFVKALIDENVEFNLYEKDSNPSSPKQYLREKYPDWVNDSGKLIIAKINYNGNIYEIANKADLDKFETISGFDFSKNLHDLALKDIFTINPILQRFNDFQFLFSQEFLLSSVGSHSNHPSKSKDKLSIIWTNEEMYLAEDPYTLVFPSNTIDLSNEELLELWEEYKKDALRENLILVTNNPRVKDFEGVNIAQDISEAQELWKKAYKQVLDNSIGEEASRFLAQHKRNVSLTATMYPFQRYQIDGPPTTYNMALLSDIFYDVYTLNGDITDWVPFDGATFVNPFVVHWENASLTEQKAGIDKKPFVHGYNLKTGTGEIIKTAGFGLTNDRIKSHKFYRIMMKNMTDLPWVESDNTRHIVYDGGILKDFEGNDVNYGEFYFERNGKYYMRKIESYAGNNTYNILDTEVDEFGTPIAEGKSKQVINVDSNYQVWKMFGGENSMELNDKGVLVSSEASILLTVRASNSYGKKNKGVTKVDTAKDVYQPMKHSDIHWAPTVGAMKQGAANINPSSAYYNVQQWNHMTVQMRQAGIQLDKEHHANNSTLSLMTQVIAGAAAKGYTLDKSTKLYQSLLRLTQIRTKDFRDSLGNITTDQDKFDAAASRIILDSIINNSNAEGDLLNIIANDLVRAMKDSKEFKLTKEFAKKIDDAIPYSNKGVFGKIVSTLTSTLTKQGIKQEVSGVLSVLNPTQDAIKLYKVPRLDEEGNLLQDSKGNILYKTVTYGQLKQYAKLVGVSEPESDVEDYTQEELNKVEESILDYLQQYAETVYEVGTELDPKTGLPKTTGSIAKVDIGKNYIVTTTKVNKQTGEITTHDYTVFVAFPNKMRDDMRIKNGLNVWGYADLYGREDETSIETVTKITDYIKEGNDLDAYTVRFTAKSEKHPEGRQYQSADLDLLQEFFNLKQIEDSTIQFTESLRILNEYNKLGTFVNIVKKEYLNALQQEYNKTEVAFRKEKLLKLISVFDSLLVEDVNLLRSLFTSDVVSKDKEIQSYLKLVAQKVLNRQLQLTLNAISQTDKGIDKVKIGGEWVTIDKESVQVQAFGAIMPKIFRDSLGLEQNDDLETIKHDPDFFIKRLIYKYQTKVNNFVDYDENGDPVYIKNFDIELKRTNGNHLYIRAGLNGARLTDEVQINTMTDDQGRVFRIDDHRRVMYQLFSKDDKVYRDYEGNEIIVTQPDTVTWTDDKGNEIVVINNKGKLETVNGHEIRETNGVYTNINTGTQVFRNESSGLQFYIDNMEYNSFFINNESTDTEFNNLLTKVTKSSNIVANNLGELIQDQGLHAKDTKEAIKKQRELSDAMNDYEALYKEYESIKDLDPEDQKTSKAYHAFKFLAKTGREMHTSFLKTLNIVAARIPAQNQQSFMAMKVQGYENPDINSAYVSTYQFFLQGSDLDIDAVSLQTFTLNKGGLFVGHSPYYSLLNETMQKESENIPFPTGTKIPTSERHSTFKKYLEYISVYDNVVQNYDPVDAILKGSFIDELEELIDGGFLMIRFKKNQDVKVSLNLNTPKKMQKFIEFLSEKEFGIGDIEDTIREFNVFSPEGRTLTEEQLESINKQLIAIIDKHNLYLNKISSSKQEAIARNQITQNVYDIIIDPINQMQAQSSVDMVTSPIKALAKTSPKATVQETFSPGNIANMHQSISENGVGRDDIAICATDLKGYFALTQMFNMIMSGDNKQAKERLINRPVTIGGKTYRGLANVYTSKFYTGESEYKVPSLEELLKQDEMFTEELKDFLVEQYLALDASSDKSGMLSLSADNAKELVLAKINAGTATMGMYLYGLSLGVPFETLYKIIASPFGERVVALTKGNLFEGNKGTIDVIGALDYLYTEPTSQLNAFDSKLDLTDIPLEMHPSQLLGENLREQINDMFWQQKTRLDTVSKIEGSPEFGMNQRQKLQYIKNYIQDYFNSKRDIINKNVKSLKSDERTQQIADQYKMVANQVIDFAIAFTDDVILTLYNKYYDTVFGSSDITADFEKLAMGAVETKQLGKNLRINQGMKTDLTIIDQVDNLQDLIIRQISQQKRYKKRHGKYYKSSGLTVEESKKFDEMLDNQNYKKLYKIDIKRFVTDPSYAAEMIALYDIIKTSFNPLQVLITVPHYKGYTETLYLGYESAKSKSAKFRYIAEKKSDYINRNHVYDPRLKEQVGTNMENAIDTFFRQEWMKERYTGKRKITMHPSEEGEYRMAFIDNVGIPKPIFDKKEILLGTTLGDANYKLWMEEVVIPKMKKLYPNNEFIQALDWISEKTKAGTIASSMGLLINMLPDSDYDKDIFQTMKKAFNELKGETKWITDGNGTAWSPQELLYLYSLIVNNGRISPTSLHKIFEDYLDEAPVRSFHAKIAEYDQSKETQDGEASGKYEQLTKAINDYAIAPFGSPYAGGSDILRQMDSETEEIQIWEKYEEEESGYDPNINIVNGYTDRLFYTRGFNTDYFLNGVLASDVQGIETLKTDGYSQLSKYEIKVQKIGKKISLVSMKARDGGDQKLADYFFEHIIWNKENKGFFLTKKVIGDSSVEDLIDLDYLNKMLEKELQCRQNV